MLAIGSVHLDTIALSSSSGPSDDTILIGDITHSVGGSAYNLAANLAGHHGRQKAVDEVAVYSILPQHSVLTEIIKFKVDAAGINSKFVRLYREFNGRHVRGGGYVGILDDKQLIRQAVVDAAMHDANIFQNRSEGAYLESAFEWADALAIDADLAVSIVNHVAEHAQDRTKPLFVCVGSPTAGIRGWIHSHAENVATCLSGRLRVLCIMLEQLKFPGEKIAAFRRFAETGSSDAHLDINGICRVLKAGHLVCSNVRDAQGFALLAAGDTPRCFFFPIPDEVRTRIQGGNSAGIMDGALAGFVEAYACVDRSLASKGRNHLSDATERTFSTSILDFVERVSLSEGATPGSVISFEEEARQESRWAKLWRLTRIAFDVLPVFKYLLSVAAAIVALYLVDLGLDVLAYFGYRIELPDKSWVRLLLRR